MPRRRKYDIASYDFTTKCTECAFAIPPAQRVEVGGGRVRCPECGVEFVPEPKGKWSQLGGPGWDTSWQG